MTTFKELHDLLAAEPADWAPLADAMLEVLTETITEKKLPPIAVAQATVAAAMQVLEAINPVVALATLEAARQALEERFPEELAEYRAATIRTRIKH